VSTCVHREVKENLGTANASSFRNAHWCRRCLGGGWSRSRRGYWRDQSMPSPNSRNGRLSNGRFWLQAAVHC